MMYASPRATAYGYGCCRLDVRGTGSSGGVAYDEYTEAETEDGCDAVAWLADQPWCSGKVGSCTNCCAFSTAGSRVTKMALWRNAPLDAPLDPQTIYAVRVPLKAIGYRFLPGQRIRVAVASALWPVIWPSPFPGDNFLHCGAMYPSCLQLPCLPPATGEPPAAQLKFTLPPLETVRDGNETNIPDDIVLFTQEELDLAASVRDPAQVALTNRVVYRLHADGIAIEAAADGAIHSTQDAFLFDLALRVKLDGRTFYARRWQEHVARNLL